MARRKRVLSEHEKEMWDKVIKHVETIEVMSPPVIAPKAKEIKTFKTEVLRKIEPFKVGAKAEANRRKSATPSIADRPSQNSPNMDRRNYQRLLRGKLEIDATLDLHGLTADQARNQVYIFINNSCRAGKRLLLIITGKGNKKTIDEFGRPRSGILRSGVPEWLKSSDMVLQVTQAHGKHGGSGAYYVYLRRKRS